MRTMGLRRALLTRRANLGDCADAPSVLRRIVKPRALRHPACVVPLSRPRRGEYGATDLALDVARRALASAPDAPPESVGALIYCHAVPDEHTAESSAGRLQFELGLRSANPFSLSQAHNTALFVALDLAAGLIEGPEAAAAVLLVAADKMLFGMPPTDAQRMTWADVAAAAVVTAECRNGWRLDEVLVRHFHTPLGTSAAWPRNERLAFAACAAAMLKDALDRSGTAVDDLAAVICCTADAAYAADVHQRVALPPAGPSRSAGVASADLLVRLLRLSAGVACGRRVLAWCHGNNGELACAVLTRSGRT